MSLNKRRRTLFNIFLAILRASIGGKTKTGLMYSSNLNWKQIQRYLPILHKHGLIAKISKKYVISSEGLRILKFMRILEPLFEDVIKR